MNRVLVTIICIFSSLFVQAQQLKIGLLVYSGGGDWYANPTSIKNLAQFCNQNLGTKLDTKEAQVEVGSTQLFNYAFVHATGHGRIAFSDAEAKNLRLYLEAGGFLHIDDNYGMDPYVQSEMKKVFPELSFVELPFTHPIYHQKYAFPNGLPKIHEHDGKQPKGYGLIYKGRLVCFYTRECDLGDGWEDPEVHKDSPEQRLKALQMGANMLQFVFSQ
jgi:hypothetical protein